MAPIPVYSSSPINAAAKASGITPQTAGGDHHSAEAPETTTSAARPQGYPVAQPGAQPTLPAVQTGAPQTSATTGLEPTPTHQQVRDGSPPAPQPGAVPVAPGTRSKIPPPPKAGESLQAAQHPPAATAVPSQQQQQQQTMPPQMSYPAPNPTYPPRAGSSTITAQEARSASGPMPTSLGELGPGDDRFSHPPGYHQNALGPGLSSRQEDQGTYTSQQRFDDDQDEEGLWGAARKWATVAGNSLAQAENEVWKRINKG